MINVSSKFKRLLYSGESNLIVDATITLADETVLEVSNPQIMSGGLEIDDAVGSDEDFDCIGSTIVNGCDLILYNNNEIYSDYDFINAKVNIAVKLQTDTTIINDVETPVYETVQKGVYTVDDATFSSISVTLKLLDNMCQFDRPYDSYDIYRSNTTIYDIVMDACEECGVMPASSLTDMPNGDFIVAGKPKDDTTYREVIGWCAAIAGCFARCNPNGELEFVWFDTAGFASDESIDGGIFDDGTPYYTSGDNVNGGVFNPWNDPSDIDDGEFTNISRVHYISALTAQNIGVDDVVITDVQIAYETGTNNRIETKYYPTTIDDDNYVISISSIPFIDSTNVQSFYNFLNSRLIGLTFRTCNITHAIHDPTIEAGDIAWLWDTKGVRHRILITRVTFPISGSQTIVCGAKTPARNGATQLTALAKANARSNRRLNEEIDIRAQLEANFNSYIANSTGLYLHQVTDTSGAVTIYGHDKPYLVESKKVLKISNGVIAMTDDYSGDDATTTWYGFQFNGTWLTNIISTIDLFFDHAKGGTLTLGGADNGNGILVIKNANNAVIGTLSNAGIDFTMPTRRSSSVNGAKVSLKFTKFNRQSASLSYLIGEIITYATHVRNKESSGRTVGRDLLRIYGTDTAEAQDFVMLKIGHTDYEIEDTNDIGIYFITYESGGFMYAQSRSTTDASGIEDYNSQPLFAGLHTSEDGDVKSLYTTRIFNYEVTNQLKLVYDKNNAYSSYADDSGKTLLAEFKYGCNKLSVPEITFDILGPKNNKNYEYFQAKPQSIGTQNYNVLRMNTSTVHSELKIGATGSIELNISQSNYNRRTNYYNQTLDGMISRLFIENNTFFNITHDYIQVVDWLNNTGKTVAWVSSSSIRYKHDIKPIEDKRLDPHKLLDLPVVQFQWNADHPLQYKDMEGKTIPGIIAEDVEKIYPSAVIHDVETGEVESWDERRIIPGMLALIQEQDKKIQELENKLAKLEQIILKLT